jgi:hypothetical protein
MAGDRTPAPSEHESEDRPGRPHLANEPSGGWATRLTFGAGPRRAAVWLTSILVAALLVGFSWETVAALIGSRAFHLGEAFRNAVIAGVAVVGAH